MTDAEKAYQYFVTAVPENEEQAKAYFWARKALLTPLTQPNDVLTCEGCVYLEELTAPCAYCARMKREVDYYRPPEGEEEKP